MAYTFHEDISIADIAFSVTAKTLEELFIDGAKATFDAMVNMDEVKAINKREILLEAENAEKLFFAWIEELIYLKDADYMVFCQFDVKITKNKTYALKGTAWGEGIDPERHTLKVDVKAITYHHFKVEQTKKGWEAFVILDI